MAALRFVVMGPLMATSMGACAEMLISVVWVSMTVPDALLTVTVMVFVPVVAQVKGTLSLNDSILGCGVALWSVASHK